MPEPCFCSPYLPLRSSHWADQACKGSIPCAFQRRPLALQAALAIVDGMKSLGGQGCIGVTTGQLLCACVGSRIRAEYTVFGDSINLSARLMCKATAGMGDILCDYSTQHMATNAAAYTRLEPLVVSLMMCRQLSATVCIIQLDGHPKDQQSQSCSNLTK